MLQATRPAAMTGRTMSAAMSRIPTIRIETPIVTPARPATTTFSRADRHPGDARSLLVEDDPGERAVEQRDHGEPRRAEGRRRPGPPA